MRELAQLTWAYKLRHLEYVDAPLNQHLLRVNISDDRVCGAEINTNQVAGRTVDHCPRTLGAFVHQSLLSRMLSSSFQRCFPSRETHQTSSVPTSVTRDSRRTGKTAPCSPSTLSVTSSGLSSSISLPQFSRRSPTWSCLRIVELRKRKM